MFWLVYFTFGVFAMTDLWPQKQRMGIEKMLKAVQKKKYENQFAVFDADNTLWEHDIAEGLLAWMEYRELISLSRMESSIFPLPPLPKENVFSYYKRLCNWDHSICYLWSAQAFYGFTLAKLKMEVDAMMAYENPKGIPVLVRKEENGLVRVEEIFVPVPKIFQGQQDLLQELRQHNIEPWVVSASAEEIVRMVASDPKYGLHIKPENVIGVNLLLSYEDGHVVSSAEERKVGNVGSYYFSEERQQAVLTHHLYAPATWYAGKVAAIKEWIHPSQRPILVAGDSPNDFYMQFYANVEDGGVRVRIHRKDSHKEELELEISTRKNGENNADPLPEKGWVEVTPDELHYK